MPDFDMCKDAKCRRRNTCLRFSAKPDEYQWYMDSPRKGNKCDYYMSRSKIEKFDKVVYERMNELAKNPTETVPWRSVRRTMDEKEYQAALIRLADYEEFFKTRKTLLIDQAGLAEEDAELVMAPAKLFYEQLKWDVEQYEKSKSKCGD